MGSIESRDLVQSADARFCEEQSMSLHLLVLRGDGMHIFIAENVRQEQPSTFVQAWYLAQSIPAETPWFDLAPRFSRLPSAVTWLQFTFACREPVAFCAAQFAGYRWDSRTQLLRGPNSFTVQDARLPALHYVATHDYDEGRGIGVFASGYGEVALCDFSGSSLHSLRRCFETITLPARMSDWALMPCEPLLCDTFSPHPYDRTADLVPHAALLASWRAHAPPRTPDGWSTDWEPHSELGAWRHFVYATCTFAWRLEHVYKILGTAVPLFRRPGALFFAAGGGRYLWLEGGERGLGSERVFVVPRETSGDGLMQMARAQPVQQGLVEALRDTTMLRYCDVDVWRMWDYDENVLGRDRIEELRTRAAMSRE
ncbi:hypothetical protein PsYK624_099300 [Phanerochaete sordida]|uniref:Uncharacterized protein n=1 Tax=Phanerochaete sordida TaxID=48140 RepID=A0A9P3GHL2_9APHY|nr:hypothetical protein PsYK624_099300 [Phanerochaete sordida]